jgi:hypothetical protein
MEQPIIIRDTAASRGANAAVPINSAHANEDETAMANYDDLYGSKWFSANDLDGEDTQRHKIGKAEPVEVREKDGTKKRKLAIWFDGVERALILNRTNYTRLTTAYGKDAVKWVGATVEVYTEVTPVGVGVRLRRIKSKPDPIATGRPDANLDDEIPYDL